MTESPVQLAAPAAGTAYGIPYITLSNIIDSDTTTAFTITFDTDAACICNITAWPGSSPGVGTMLGPILDASARTHHVLTITPAAGNAGQVFSFSINLDPTDTTGLTFRSYVGVTQLVRRATPDVPVRFYAFGGTPPPGAGGTPGGYNWNTYVWAQYNPKGTTFPTP